jgi:UDP-2,3-diacylglucosamine pyrophosphatase LpxH
MTGLKTNPLTYIFTYGKDEDIKILIASDVHYDNPKCNRELFFDHLKKAKAIGAKVIIKGDLFCLMQGKYDPRRSKKEIRPEHNVANYIDAVIESAVDELGEYADTIMFVSEGNHETAILKNLETDVLTRFVEKFNERYKVNVIKGGYRGWIIIRKEKIKNKFTSYKIYYHHGYGGGGEMTKGILQHSRMNMHIENADAIVMGHVHEMYIQVGCTEYFDNSHMAFKPKTRNIYNIRTATYKDEFGGIDGGFHIERGRAPKPLGGVFLDLQLIRNETENRIFYPTYTLWN